MFLTEAELSAPCKHSFEGWCLKCLREKVKLAEDIFDRQSDIFDGAIRSDEAKEIFYKDKIRRLEEKLAKTKILLNCNY